MKEATGELNLTVITVVAIAAIAAIVYTFIWPLIQTKITTDTCQSAYGEDWEASKADNGEWQCCPTAGGACAPLD